MGNETATMRKQLLQKKQSEIIKECKKHNVSYNGSKCDMVDRLIKKHKMEIAAASKIKCKNCVSKDDEIRDLKHQLSIMTDKYNKLKLENQNLRSQALGSVIRKNNKIKEPEKQRRTKPKIKNKAEPKAMIKYKPKIENKAKPKAVIKYKPKIENKIIAPMDTKMYHEALSKLKSKEKEKEFYPEYIEWFDLEVLRNIVGVWMMGERGTSYEFMKVDLKMNDDGEDRKWRAHIKKGNNTTDFRCELTNIYGEGRWCLMYPTSINVRQNIYHICNYYISYYSITICHGILSRDIINVIGDYTLGVGVRSLDLINMQLILSRDSFRTTKGLHDKQYTFNGYDATQDFTEIFGFSLGNSMVDLLSFCLNQVENKKENNLNHYENIMKLQQFTDDEDEDQHFNQYFHHDGDENVYNQ